MITDTGKLSYAKKLDRLSLQSLEERRKRGDLIDTYKYLNAVNDINPFQIFTCVQERHEKPTRSFTENKLVPEKTSLNVRKNFFTNRVVNDWNVLPHEIRYASSVNSFKNLYDCYVTVSP